MFDYDLLVIGCGPGGQKAAIAAAKLGKRAAVVEGAAFVGGACVNTGTIPSKTLRRLPAFLWILSSKSRPRRPERECGLEHGSPQARAKRECDSTRGPRR